VCVCRSHTELQAGKCVCAQVIFTQLYIGKCVCGKQVNEVWPAVIHENKSDGIKGWRR